MKSPEEAPLDWVVLPDHHELCQLKKWLDYQNAL